MEKLTQLIRSLNSREILSIKKYYQITGIPDRNLKRKLFEILLDKKSISDKEAAQLLKKSSPDASFSMLKKRLRSDILKILVWEEGAKTFSSKYHEAKYKCRLMVLEAEILITRGLQQFAEERLQKALKISQRYELTSESLTINDLLQEQVGVRQGLNSYKYYANNNIENLDIIKEKFAAQDYFRKLVMPNLFFTNKEMNYREKSEQATRELKLLSEKSSSVQIKFWYLRSEVYYNHLINNYERAKESAEAFLELVTNSPIVHSRDNMGGANMQLAIINTYLQDFSLVRKYANDSLNFFIKGSINQVNAYDVLFTAHLFSREYHEAAAVIETVLQYKALKTNQLLQSKWLYYEANLEFSKKNYAEALAILQKQTELTSDKSGWRLGYKILEMMCIMELGYFDWLDYRIETFRKLLSDVRKENIARPKLIHQLIRNFIKAGYDFDDATIAVREALGLLLQASDDYRWDPKGYELIRFDIWWQGKLKKVAVS